MTSPVTESYPWEQLSILEPDRMQLRVTLSLVGPSDSISCTLELRSGAERDLVGMQTFGSRLSPIELEEVLCEIRRWSVGALERIAPF